MNLKEERKRMSAMKLFNAKGELITEKIISKIEEQDKEFIRLVKSRADLDDIDCDIVDKLSGYEE